MVDFGLEVCIFLSFVSEDVFWTCLGRRRDVLACKSFGV